MPPGSSVALGPKLCLRASCGMKEPEVPGCVWTAGQEMRVDTALVQYHRSTWGTSINSPNLLGPRRQPHPFSTLQPGEGACLPGHCSDFWEQTRPAFLYGPQYCLNMF